MSERPMCKACKASVMVYDDAEKKWRTKGRSPGLSGVCIYRHTIDNTFRVIGRKDQDGEVVINCAIIPQLKYNRATTTFHQWRDGARTVYGLNFSTPEEANEFAAAMDKALDLLRGGIGPPGPPAPSGPSAAEIEAKRREQEMMERQRQERDRLEKEKQEKEKMERERMERERMEREKMEREKIERERMEQEKMERERRERERMERERMERAAMPAPAAPPGPPPPSNVDAPPPPPPPPPPSGLAPAPSASNNGGGVNQGMFAAALKGAQLKPTKVSDRSESAAAPPSVGGGMDIMAELRLKQKLRNESGDSGKLPTTAIAPKPTSNVSSYEANRRKPPQSSPNMARKDGELNGFATNKLSSMNKRASGGTDMDQFKQEILSEMKIELQKVKEEIIRAFHDELRQ